VVLSACASSGSLTAGNLTNVELSGANFRVVATDVGGQASAGYIIGITAPQGSRMQTVAVARVEGTGQLYREALEDLWANFRAEHGATEGRSLALANVRFDSDALNLFVYTASRVSVRADVIEFVP
jgi:hypothetical protein